MKSVAMAALAAACLHAGAARAIVGGAEDAGPRSRTSVMVLSSKGGVCTAVVVARDAVLTAAHCVPAGLEHRVHFRDPSSGEPVLLEVSARVLHPGYDAKAIEGRRRSIDLALLRVGQPLPARFETAVLSAASAPSGTRVTVGGYGVTREGDGRSTGVFRFADLAVVEPYGPSRLLVWMQGEAGVGACTGDSGGPVWSTDAAVFALTSWTTGPKGRTCGRISQGVLLGLQRAWIDRTLASWGVSARWE